MVDLSRFKTLPVTSKVDLSKFKIKPAPVPQPKGFLQTAGESLANFGVGVVKGAAQDITGMGKAVTTGIGKGLQETKIPQVQQFGKKLVSDVNAPQPSSILTPKGTAQQLGAPVGGAIIDIGTLAAPTGAIKGAKAITEALPIAEKVGEIPVVGKVAGYITQKVLNAIPEAVTGFGYGLLKGQTPKEAAGTGAVFGAFSGMGEVVGDTWKAFKGTLADNINKALGGIKGKGVNEVLSQTKKSIDALKTISNLSSDIKVLDKFGVEKVFNPLKADFGETLQAFKQTKYMVYKSYTDLAKQVGDAGVKFSKEDFTKLMDTLSSQSKDATSGIKSKASSLMKDLVDNFGKVNKGGKVSFQNTDLQRIQSFLENVNKDVNPMSDRAGAEVSGKLSQQIREVLDDKITAATTSMSKNLDRLNEGEKGIYQKLRDGYTNLKSIENNLVNQFKKASGKSGSQIGKYIEGFGGIDLITSLITKSPVEAVRGGLMVGLGKIFEYLRDPEVNLQRAFQQLQEQTPQGAVSTRLFGKLKP